MTDTTGRPVIDSNFLIEKYQMLPHPEGGFYVETFRSDCEVQLLVSQGGDNVHSEQPRKDVTISTRPASTAIYFLVVPGNISRLHRIKSDEIWHFYLGGPMTVIELLEDGSGAFKATSLGSNITAGEVVQYVVKKDTWFGSFPNVGTEFSFVGCTVSPGFVFEDFELASRSKLLALYPAAVDIIVKLTEGLP